MRQAAFPSPGVVLDEFDSRRRQQGAYEGMTLRDYFAAKALQGVCANPGAAFQSNPRSGWDFTNCDEDVIAQLSYRMADAMLKARDA